MQKINKLVIVVDSIDVDNSSGARANLALINNLSQYFDLRVYHYSFKVIQLPSIETTLIQENRRNWRFIISRLHRLTRRHLKIDLNKMIENFIGFSFTFLNDLYSFNKSLSSVPNENIDLIITLSQGASFLPHFAILEFPTCYSKWISYIHDPYPVAYYPKAYAFNGAGTRYKSRLMQQVIAKSKNVVFPSFLLSEWVSKFYDIDKTKKIIIPHQIDFNLPDCGTDNLNIIDSNEFCVLHAGNLMSQRNPIPLIRAFNHLCSLSDKSIKMKLFLIGPLCRTHSLHISEENLSAVKFLPTLNFVDTYQLQRLCSVNVILEADDELSPFLPGKFPHCIAAGNPILLLGPEISESRRLLGEDYPYYARPNDFEPILSCLEQLLQNWMRKKPFKFEAELHDYMSASKLNDTISSLIAND